MVLEIRTIEDLDNIRNNLSENYILMNDLDFNDDSSYQNPANKEGFTTGSGWLPVGTTVNWFTGTLNGNNHIIKNLYINRNATDYVGLFSLTGFDAKIHNLYIKQANVLGRDYTGILIGLNGCEIFQCTLHGTVQGRMMVGGLTGYSWYDLSYNMKGAIIECSTTGTVISTFSGSGGLTGGNFANITNSYSQANVIGINAVGGLIGYHGNGTITRCYAANEITGTQNVGGLIGFSQAGTGIHNFWDKELSGVLTSALATGKTTDEMMQKSTFTTWSMNYPEWYDDEIWLIQEGGTYPYLSWTYKPVIITPYKELTALHKQTEVLDSIEEEPIQSLKQEITALQSNIIDNKTSLSKDKQSLQSKIEIKKQVLKKQGKKLESDEEVL